MVEQKRKKKIKEKIFLWGFWGILLTPVAVIIIVVTLTAFGVFGTLPTFEELENPNSNFATEIYSDDGVLLGSYFYQNRSRVSYEELSPALIAALIATEDVRYYSHSGIDFISLARVGIKTIVMGNRRQGGGSTVSQQLAKNLFPRDTTTYTSSFVHTSNLILTKFKEWITAVKLEHNYTKDEIVTMYFNTVFYGSNSYGIKAGAQTFFNKEPHQLTIPEAALLVGVVNAPTRYSPTRNPKNALNRRNIVMSRMEKNGNITEEQYEAFAATPITLDFNTTTHNDGIATYFREMIRLTMTAKKPTQKQFYTKWDYEQELIRWENNPLYGWCVKNKKTDGSAYNIYSDGLKIYTTLSSTMQEYAEEALVNQLTKNIQPAMDKQYENTGVLFKDLKQEGVDKIIAQAIRYSDRNRALRKAGASDEEVKRIFNTKVNSKIFTYDRGEVDTLISPLDSILHHKRIMRASLMAMDPNNGHVKAYVGGPNFRYFKYDMVKQGKRQVGSTIKPFIYTFAFDHLGYNPCMLVPNLAVTIETFTGEAWTPKEAGTRVNYDGKRYPLRWGLARSRNNYSAWIMKQAKQPQAVADFIYNMGITSFIYPSNALCLGTPDVSLFEMVGAYSTFVNKGVYTEPIFVTRIEDRQGNLLATFTPNSTVAINEHTAYTMLGMLEAAIQKGTGIRMVYSYGMKDVEAGGKTGTSQENRDGWFMCVTPNLVGGVWVGGEDQSVHLESRGEGSVVALPIFGDFLNKVYKNPSLGIKREDVFYRPTGAVDYDCWDGSTNTTVAEDEFEIETDNLGGEPVEPKGGNEIVYDSDDGFFD